MKAKTSLWVGCGEWGFRELPLEEHFKIAKQFGFRFLEIGIGGDFPGRLPGGMSSDGIEGFLKLKSAYQIETPQCCLENDFTLPDAADHAAMVRRTLQEIELAARLGANQVRLFAGFTPAREMTEEIWGRLLDGLRKCQSLCASLGLTIAIETHGKIEWIAGSAHHVHTVSTDPACLERLVKELPPEVGFNFDPGNLKAVAPNDRSYQLSLLDERITYCHLKDWRRRGDGWEAVAIGDDDLDYGSLLPRMSYDGIYLIEYEPTGDVEDGIRRSLEYLRKLNFDLRFA
jgi:Sugar phosphate isomerases/epimerases